MLAERCTAQMEGAVAGLANAAIHANTCDPPGILFGVQAIFDFFRRRLPREWKTWRDTVADNFRSISHKDFRDLG